MNHKLISYFCFLLLLSCAKERDVKSVIPNGKRIAKSDLAGTFVYLRSLSRVDYLGSDTPFLASGMYLDSDQLVRLEIKENSLDIVSIDPLYREESAIERNSILASFAVRHVDILRKQNADGVDTNEEEQTETRRVWQEREFVIVDLTKNYADSLKNLKSVTPSDSIEVDRDSASLLFSITKQLQDDTLITEKYSLMRFQPSLTYEQKPYPSEMQDRFGFFKTRTYHFDKYGRPLQSLTEDYMNRWDDKRKIVYYLSKDFPARLKPVVYEVFRNWNQTFEKATGLSLLELRENSGQLPGDLHYNMIVYDDSKNDNGLLGYGPTVTNPRTGEIIKGDVFIYGSTLKRAIGNERMWAKLLGVKPQVEVRDLFVAPMNKPKLPTKSVESFTDFLKPATKYQVLDASILNTIKARTKSPSNLVTSLREKWIREQSKCTVKWDQDTSNAISDWIANREVTDEEIEYHFSKALLTHELGHNFGLRHNFMGSADEAHFHEKSHTSSVMDYGYLGSQEPGSPAPYDIASIAVAYGKSSETYAKERAKNYLYCTDENLYDSRMGLCHQFDSGTHLTEVLSSQLKRYRASYYFNNLKLDRVNFGGISDSYLENLFAQLVPIRLTLDHASTIVEIAKTIKPESKSEGLLQMWRLLKQQIEADDKTVSPITLQVSSNYSVKIDYSKIAPIVLDAEKAKIIGILSLSLIIKNEPVLNILNSKEERSDYDLSDPRLNDVQVRGILFDRLIALSLMSLRTPHPLGGGGGISLFESAHTQVAFLYSGILSNTDTVHFGEFELTDLRVYEPNVRSFMFELYKDMASLPSIEAGELKEMSRLEKIRNSDPQREALIKLSDLRQQLVKATVAYHLNKDPIKDEQLKKQMEDLDSAIQSIPWASENLREGLDVKAPLRLDKFKIDTASGYFIKNNINVIEDRARIAESEIQELTIQWNKEADLNKKAAIKTQISGLEESALTLNRYVETERTFLEKMYRFYSPQ